MDWHHLFETELGWVRLTYRGEAIARSGFGWTERDEALSGLGATNDVEIRFDRLPRSSEGRYRFAEACREAFDTYAANGDDRLQQLPIIEPARTEFQRAVILACRAIPAGETMTYGELATVAGSPGASRAVGNQMARNPLPLLVPCHRVVPTGRGLGGFSAPQGVAMKRRLLELESQRLVLR